MNLCILENDFIDPAMAQTYTSYGAMVERLFKEAGAHWNITLFKAFQGQFPDTYKPYDAVLLTGSRSDSFSNEPWIIELRQHVQHLLSIKKKLLGICFGHQLIALCLGSQVGRAPQGWGMGLLTYDWHAPNYLSNSKFQGQQPSQLSLLASNQDQVFDLPKNATLLASSTFCPVAAFNVKEYVFCVQAHPEFVTDYSAYLLDKRQSFLNQEHYTLSATSLKKPHDGLYVARMMIAFVEGTIG